VRIERQDGSDEKTVLIGMIVDDRVCGRITGKWKQGLFRSKWSNLVGGWCVKHFERYGHAPGKKIQHCFEQWAEKGGKDDATVDLVERFLSGLSDEWSELKRDSNSEYVLDVAGKHFALVQVEKFKEELEDHVRDKEPEKAVEAINGYNQVKLGLGEGIDVLQDKEAWKAAFGERVEPIIEFTGPLGDFFGDCLARECFVSFEGPEGRGKSMILQEIAIRGVMQRRKVAYFQLGDMSRNQQMRRMGVRIAQHPIKPCTVDWPASIKVTDEEAKDGEKPRRKGIVSVKKKEFKEGMDWQRAWKACQEMCRSRIKSFDSYWKLFNYAPDVLHCRDIEGVLVDLQREGWVADIVCIDYSDLLSMTYAGKEGRDCINETWKHMRKISILHHCLVVTATQTNSASNDAYTIKRKHFADDKRKRGHITAGFALNQTEEEKDDGIMRFNSIKKRDEAYSESLCIFIAQCLPLANPMVRSSF